MAVSFMVSILALVPAAFAQDKSNICGWQQIRGGVVRDSLYLEGGLRTLGGAWSSSDNTFSNCVNALVSDGRLFKLNFSKSFDVSSTNFKNLFDTVTETSDASAPFFVNGGMFADSDEFYTIGGMAYPQYSNTSLAQGAVRAGLFQPSDLATSFVAGVNPTYQIPADISKFITHGAGVSIPSESLGFYFSGLSTGSDTPISYIANRNATNRANTLLSTMLKVDTSSTNSATWQELSIPANVSLRAGASAAWIPTGARGALVIIGGTIYPGDIYDYALNDTQVAVNNGNSSGFIVNVPVFDIASNTWYSVNATGSPTPPPFVHACTVVASAADGSSHQIFVYGGYDGIGRANADGTSAVLPSDEVWILSVPSFTWVRASAGTANHGRYAHTCAKPYPNQMITVGGVSWRGNSLKTQAIVDNFDLNALTWTGTYDPTKYADYKVAKIVTDVIGGNADGGATNVASGMAAGLRTVFSTKYTTTIPKWYPYAAESTATPTPDPHKKSVAVPVAVSVVVVVVVLVTAIIAWCCFCSPAARKRRSEKASDDTTQVSSHNFVSKWVNSTQFHPPPKSVISSDATEIGESLSPRAEVAGFSYFTPHARPGGASEVEGTQLYGQNRAGTRATSPGSPGSHGSAELEGVPTPPPGMTEIMNNQRNTEVFRNHPFYPASIGGQSAGSSALPSRFHNARAPSDSASNTFELPQNRSAENVGLAPPAGMNRSKSDKSHTETSTDISAPTDSDADLRAFANQSSSGIRTPELVPHQPHPTKDALSKPPGGKSYPPTALSNIASQSKPSHHRSTSSASSGMAITLSPSASETYATISPAEEQRRSDHISSLPEPVLRNMAADADTTAGKKN